MTACRIPKLMLVTDRRNSQLPLPEVALSAIRGGVDTVQIREKDLDEAQLKTLLESVVAAIGDPSRISVNGNMAVAQALGVGLHLPEAGLRPAEARKHLGPDALIGRSIHSPEAARESEGADYLVAGHIFATASKPGRPPIGSEGLRRIVEAAPCPVLAIGGLTVEHVHSVLSAGAFGVAVVSVINSAADPESAARAIREKIDRERNVAMTTVATQAAVTINGKLVVLDEGTTIQQFLHSKGYQDRLVVVELNESILPRDAYSTTSLVAGDRVEIVHFVGGG
jgi:thiamine-phosphate pyrophosphorylase